MPFVLRQVTPVRLSRLPDGAATTSDDDPRLSISNATLSACLRQLASLVSLAGDIFTRCQDEASTLQERSVQLAQRLDRLQINVDRLDSRSVIIPEGDLASFSHDHKTNHFSSKAPVDPTSSQVPELKMLTPESRPDALKSLYDRAASLVIPPTVNRPDSLLVGIDGMDAADYGRLIALGATLRRRRKQRSNVLEIETRRPASLAHMRQWLTDDDEAVLDDLSAPVGPDNRRLIEKRHSDRALHRLPSPEEKAKVAASQVFPAEMVRLDVTGSSFQRMTQFRRSLQHFELADGGSTLGQQPPTDRIRSRSGKRSSSGKRKGKKRRNTIACDGDRREIHDVLAARGSGLNGDSAGENKSGSRSSLRQRLNLVHLLRTSLMTTPSTGKASGSALTSSDMSYDESDNTIPSMTTTDATSHASSELVVQVTAGNLVTATRTRSGAMMNTISRLRRLGTDHTFVSGPVVQPSGVRVDVHAPPTLSNGSSQSHSSGDGPAQDSDLYELIPSEKEFGTLGTARPPLRGTVKLRSGKESSNDGRSSSGNWSASGSSCSTRASLDSDHRRPGHLSAASPLAQRHPRLAQQQQHQQRSFSPEMDVDSALSGDDCSATTTSSTSQRPDNGGGHNELDLETSSVYSCDAEGYYTSFHIDSGLKTLKEGQSEASLHGNRPSGSQDISPTSYDSHRSSGLSSASGNSTPGAQQQQQVSENEYELFGKGSTLSNTTTSSAGTVIFRPDGLPNNNNNTVNTNNNSNQRKKRNSQPPEPPPRNNSNRNSVASTAGSDKTGAVDGARQLSEAESKEIADALRQLRTSDQTEAAEEASRERIRAKTQIERIPAMCVVTPSSTPLPSDTDDHSPSLVMAKSVESQIQSVFLQHVASPPRINVADLPAVCPAPTETPIVIKASVVKCPADQELVALNQLPTTGDGQQLVQPFSSSAAGSSESSRSSSLERKKRGARVTLDSDGKVVYSSDSLKRRKAQAGHSTFEPGQETQRRLDPGTSAFRPNPIGSPTTKPLSPPPYRPAPAFNGVRMSSTAVRTQPDGQTAQQEQRSAAPSPATASSTVLVSRSDSYRMANEDEVENNEAGSFQRNRSDSYRRANPTATIGTRLTPLNTSTLSGFAVNNHGRLGTPIMRTITTAAGTGQFISGHLTDKPNGSWDRSRSAQPMSYAVKSPMLVKQISNPHNFQVPAAGQNTNGRPVKSPVAYTAETNGSKQFYNRQVSSPAMMMTSSPLLAKPGVNNPNVNGRRVYGGPKLLVNPKHLPNQNNNNKSGSISSLNSSGGSGLDISMTAIKKLNGFPIPASPVVRPPTNAKDRPSFFNTPDGAGTRNGDGSPLPGYQSLSPPPRMSALPLAQLSGDQFQRKDFRYNSLPARFKTAADYYASGRSSIEPDYNRWLPTSPTDAKKFQEETGATNNVVGRESPEEGGFLEYNNNPSAAMPRQQRSNSSSSSTSSNGNTQQESSPTPSFSSCSLDGSFTSSLNESVDVRPGHSWPSVGSPHPTGMVVHSVGLVKRTTISDFKRKLLQLHHPVQRKMSAVEQLKATQPPPAGIRGPSPDVSPVTKHPALENFIRRSARVSYIANRLSQQQRNNRFQHSPRTDVLSSTIAEGRSEEELAAEQQTDDPVKSNVTVDHGFGVRRHLSFQHSRRGSSSPSSGSSTPIETSL